MNARVYKIKKLIPGHKLGHPGKNLVAFKDTYLNKGDIKVVYDGKVMIIKDGQEVLTYRKGFKDKFGRKLDYGLCYFEWKPL